VSDIMDSKIDNVVRRSDEGTLEGALEARVRDLREWLREHGPDCATEQKHLDEGSAERTYWHYGYLSALIDTLAQLRKRREPLS
jgi:hypothetical protein